MNALFYDKIFNMLLNTRDDYIRHTAFQILSNIVSSDKQRIKLADNFYFQRVFEKIQTFNEQGDDNTDLRSLENLSWLATLIAFHQDMFDYVVKMKMLKFILSIAVDRYPSTVRSNAVLAISLMTYNEKLFDEIIQNGVIDLIMAFCRDQNQDEKVQEYSTLALVHFALNKKSIKILIEKNVLDLFDTFGKQQTS